MIKPQSGRHRAGKRRITVALLVLATLAGASQAAGHGLSPQECLEGGDFIAHAAQSRDNGMTRTVFLDNLVADIRLIQAFPAELRWFVVDPEDAVFLHTEASKVFDAPLRPEAHRAQFLSLCFDR